MNSGTESGSKQAKPTREDVAAARRLKAIWEARKSELNLTQTNFGDVAGVGWSQGAVSQYLSGKIPLNYNALLTFARVLGFEPDEVRSDLPEQRLTAPQRPSADEINSRAPGALREPAMRKFVEGAEGETDIEGMVRRYEWDILSLRTVLSAVLVSLARSTPGAAAEIHDALKQIPQHTHGYLADALQTIREAQRVTAEEQLSALRREAS